MNEQNSKRGILIIEDDVQLAKVISNLFKIQGIYDPYIAENGSVGIQKAFELIPDMILCDIGMSDIDGYQVFKILKESSITSMIPFIFLTGRSELDDIRLGLQLGADDYIVKPFQNDELLQSIKTRLAKYDQIVELSRKNFQALLTISPNIIFILNENGFTDISPSFTRILGYSAEDIENKAFADLIVDEDRLRIIGDLNKSFRGIDGTISTSARVVKKNLDKIEINLFLQKGTTIKGKPNIVGVMVEKTLAHNNSGMLMNEDEIKNELQRIAEYISENQSDVSEELVNQLKAVYQSYSQANKQNNDDGVNLSRREKEVLVLSCKGFPIKQIADQLFISDRTVEKHRANLMAKTGSKNIVEVIIYAIKHDLIEI